jgi:hypothetical protein
LRSRRGERDSSSPPTIPTTAGGRTWANRALMVTASHRDGSSRRPGMRRCYERFAASIESMVRQSARLVPAPCQAALHEVLSPLQGSGLTSPNDDTALQAISIRNSRPSRAPLRTYRTIRVDARRAGHGREPDTEDRWRLTASVVPGCSAGGLRLRFAR